MIFKSTIEKLINGHTLREDEAYHLMKNINTSVYDDIQTTAFIIALSSRYPSLEEIVGFKKALMELSIKVPIDDMEAIDVCGTGGDKKNTFNISTLSAFIIAAANYKVIKHGNYAMSSICGSSNVLEYLGYRFSTDYDKLMHELDNYNICFLHAPLFHPALKNVGKIRQKLGIRTIFNIMGPLINPADPPKQMMGVYDPKLARIYHYVLQKSRKDYAIIHSVDGYDEISLTSPFQCFSSNGEHHYKPSDLNLDIIDAKYLNGGTTIQEAVDIFMTILSGDGNVEQTQVVAANAGMGIHCFAKDIPLEICISLAKEKIESGAGLTILKKLIDKQ